MSTVQIVIAAACAMAFVSVAFWRPACALAIALGSAPFAYDLLGGPVRVAAAELAAALLFVVAVIARRSSLTLGPLWLPLSLYAAVCVLSSALNWRDSAPIALAQLVFYTLIVVAAFVAMAPRAESYLPALLAFVAAGVVIAVAEFVSRTSYVIGLHKNSAGASLASALVVAAGFWLWTKDARARWSLVAVSAVLVGGLVISLSRGAWLGAVAGVLVLAVAFGNLKFLGKALLLLAPVAVVGWFLAPERLRRTAGMFAPESFNIFSRLQFVDLGLDEFQKNPLLGTGQGFRKDVDSTNVLIATLAESGVLGLIAFLSIHVVALWLVRRVTRRMPATDPRFMIAWVGLALLATRFTHGLVDHYWSRGVSLIAWAGLAMAVRVYRDVRDRSRAVGTPSSSSAH